MNLRAFDLGLERAAAVIAPVAAPVIG
jgi:hypothetical protein